MEMERAHFNMIEQAIRPVVTLDPQTIETLSLVRRDRFVPAAFQDLAWADVAVPLPVGQHMLAPNVVGRLLQAVRPQRGESVLLVGSGSGYLAALLAVHAESVFCLEIEPELVQFAIDSLEREGVSNAVVEQGDGLAGAPELAPFDLIVVTGAVETLPASWLDQLKPTGRLLAFVGSAPVMTAKLIRHSAGAIDCRRLFETLVDPLREPHRSSFRF